MQINENKEFDLSFIIINYNRFDLTYDCIFTIKKYIKNIKYELIVVDNNSSFEDNQKIMQDFPETIWIWNRNNKGFGHANNIGVENARGKYVLLVNNDVLFIEDAISPIIEFYSKLNKPTLIGCELLNADTSHQVSIADFDNFWNVWGENLFIYKIFPKWKLFNRFYENYVDLDKIKPVDILKGAFIFTEKAAFNKIGGFDTDFLFYSEEHDLCKRFKENGGDVLYFPNTKIIHLGGATTTDIPWYGIRNLSNSKIIYFKKHFSGLEYFFIIFAHFLGIAVRVPIYLIYGILKLNKHDIRRSWLYFRLLFVYPKNKFTKMTVVEKK